MVIIFDFYLNEANLHHVYIKPHIKKIIKIPFYISLSSTEGYFDPKNDLDKNYRKFFTMMNHFFVIEGGIDCLTEHKNYIPYFICFDKYRPNSKMISIGIFSTLFVISKMRNLNFIQTFI